MMQRIAATTAACLILSCPQLIGAQGTRAGEASTELGISAGVGQSMRRDLSASPLDFAGHGGDAALALRHASGRSILELSVNGGSHVLTSSSANSLATERVGEGRLVVALLRTLGSDVEGTSRISVGAAFTANAMLTRHAYGDPTHRSSDFVFASGGIGPAAAWRTSVSSAVLDAQLVVPIASVAEHSYSIVNEHDAATDWRFASPKSLRAASATARLTSSAARRMGITWLYRADLLRYDDVQPVRAFTQSLSVGVVARFGRTP